MRKIVRAGGTITVDAGYVPPPRTPEEIAEKARAATDLTPDEFEYMLDISGLDDAWMALAAELKATDRKAYAGLQAERRKSVFRLDYTLQRVAEFRPVLSDTGYDISDLTDANITARWNDTLARRG